MPPSEHIFDVRSAGRITNSPFRQSRILFVSGTLSGGGAERFASTLLQHLSRDLFKLSLCLFRDEISYPLASDVDLSIISHRGPLSTLRSVSRLTEVIDKVKPDIVVSIMDYLGMFVGEALRSSKSQPVWIARTSNNPELLFGSVRGKCHKLWLNRVYPRVDQFIGNSEGLVKSFGTSFPCARGKIRMLRNPVDIERLEKLSQAEWAETIDTSTPNLFYSARLRQQKRPDVLIDAFRIVLENTAARLWICGDGPLKGAIERSIDQHNLRPHVRLVGFRENVFPLLKAASVAIATSDYEGLPNNVLEAQALGIPVVSTRSSFGPEEIIIHEKTGFLTERGNAHQIAQAILQLLHDKQLHASMSAAGRKRMQDVFALKHVIPTWEDFLCEVAGHSARRAA